MLSPIWLHLQSTLADEFLADLEELDDDSGDEQMANNGCASMDIHYDELIDVGTRA